MTGSLKSPGGPLRYAVPFVALATVPLGFELGGVGAWLTVAATPVALLFGDQILGPGGPEGSEEQPRTHRALVWLYLPLQLATLIWAAWAVQQPALSWITRLGLTLSVGVSAGVFGMVAAHEFLHSPRRLERALALTFLASVGYMHFRIAHVHGHHRRAATPDDPATARAGESAYAFLFRSVSGQWREAWAHEAPRPRGRRRGGFSLGNRMIQYIVIQGLIVIGLAAFAPAATPFWFAQAVVAIVLLELFNYVAHYGLERRVIPGRGREPFGPQHCWSVSRRMTNAALFNMGRHASHHRFSARPYQTLEETPSSPELPGGYAGAILLAMVPPLWRRVINPRLVAVERLGP